MHLYYLFTQQILKSCYMILSSGCRVWNMAVNEMEKRFLSSWSLFLLFTEKLHRNFPSCYFVYKVFLSLIIITFNFIFQCFLKVVSIELKKKDKLKFSFATLCKGPGEDKFFSFLLRGRES